MKLALNLFFFIAVCGCAYRWGPHQRQLPGGQQKVFVKMFENRTQEVGIESEVTNAFIQQLSRSGVGEVVNQNEAQVQLVGIIHTIDYLGKTSTTLPDPDTNDLTLFTEYQARVSVVLRAIDKEGKEVWQGQFLGERNYKAPQMTTYGLRTANPIYNQNARRRVVKAIAEDMANEAVGRMTENF